MILSFVSPYFFKQNLISFLRSGLSLSLSLSKTLTTYMYIFSLELTKLFQITFFSTFLQISTGFFPKRFFLPKFTSHLDCAASWENKYLYLASSRISWVQNEQALSILLLLRPTGHSYLLTITKGNVQYL